MTYSNSCHIPVPSQAFLFSAEKQTMIALDSAARNENEASGNIVTEPDAIDNDNKKEKPGMMKMVEERYI